MANCKIASFAFFPAYYSIQFGTNSPEYFEKSEFCKRTYKTGVKHGM